MSGIDVVAVARRVVLTMACVVGLLSVAVFLVLLFVQRDSLLEATEQAAPLAVIAMLSVYGAAMARYLAPR